MSIFHWAITYKLLGGGLAFFIEFGYWLKENSVMRDKWSTLDILMKLVDSTVIITFFFLRFPQHE